MIARASQQPANQASDELRGVPPRSRQRTRKLVRATHVAACAAPWREPAHLRPNERLRELAALWAAAYARWKALAAVSDGERACARPRAPGAARASRGQVHHEERTP